MSRRSASEDGVGADGVVRRALHRFGWRAIAVPVLLAVTVAALVRPDSRAPAAAAPERQQVAVPVAAATSPASFAPPAPITIGVLTDSTACMDNSAANTAIVSISQQHVWMCDGPRQVYSTPATTGATAKGQATPTGSWVVQDKQTNRYLTGPGYSDFVHYWVPFDGDYGFHDASWQTMPYGTQGYTTQGSNGCVHLPASAMSWFYGWAQTGSTVVTIVS